MGHGGTTTRRQVKQTLDQYARSLGKHDGESIRKGFECAAKKHRRDDKKEPGPENAQAILDTFKRMVKNARACEIPALAVLHLPVPPGRISIVFDNYQACNHHYDDSNVVVLVTKQGAEVYWYHASISTTRGF